jgi:hypothetical protein
VTRGRRLSASLYYDSTLNQDLVAHTIAAGFLVRF